MVDRHTNETHFAGKLLIDQQASTHRWPRHKILHCNPDVPYLALQRRKQLPLVLVKIPKPDLRVRLARRLVNNVCEGVGRY